MKGGKRPAPGEAENNGKRATDRGKGEHSSTAEKEEESVVEQEGVQDSQSKSRRGGEEDDIEDIEAKHGSQDEDGKGGASAGGEKSGAADSSQSKRQKEVRQYEYVRLLKKYIHLMLLRIKQYDPLRQSQCTSMMYPGSSPAYVGCWLTLVSGTRYQVPGTRYGLHH